MATTTQNVIIDFQADFTSVEQGIDVLAQMGKVDKELADQFKKTNTEVNKQGQAFDQTAKKAQGSVQTFTKLASVMKNVPAEGMKKLVVSAGELAASGVKVEDFFNKVKKGSNESEASTETLRQRLKLLKEQMQEAALNGGVLTDRYKELKRQAGLLDDTIKDVAKDIANAGSDTRNIDNVVGSISALAGGYSAVQGAAALFGEESEDLQKALLKVNAAMALATGLQQVSNALQKEGSLLRLADAAATGAQTVAQRLYTVVVGQSVGAMKLFRIALASTGIGLLVIGLISLINNFGSASTAAKKFKKDLDAIRESADRNVAFLEREGETAIALLEARGAKQGEVSQKEKENIKSVISEREKELALLREKREVLNDVGSFEESVFDKQRILFSRRKQIKEVEEAIKTSEKNIVDLRQKSTIQSLSQVKEEREERERLAKEQADKQKEIADKALQEAKKRRALEFADFQAGIELKLLAAEKGSQQELELQKDLLRAKLMIDLEGEDVTLNQRKLLIQQFFKDRIELEKKFNADLVAASIEDQKNRDAALLENLNLTEQERLDVKIEYLQLSAAQEIAAAEGNAAKILAINAKLNADITRAKVDSIKKAAADELALSGATGGVQRRALEATAANERLKAEIRINAIRQLGEREQAALDRQIKANRDAIAVQGSDQRALTLEYEQLLDQKAAAAEATEKKITDITKAEQDKRQANDIAYIQAATAGLTQLADIIGSIQANDQAAADDAIKRKRKEVEELLEAGAITEKEARERNRRIEIEERQAKQRAAQQQKNLAVFQALLAIPQAYIAGLTAPFPIGGPIYGAILAGIAAAQAAIVASRPIPKFATGKKGSYSGLAEVGEVGAELIQRADGSMQVATRRSMVYLGQQDKVFTHGETKRMMPFVNKEAISATAKGFEFDYNKMAKAVNHKGNSTVVNIDKEFISESVKDGLSRVNYFDRYYNSKG